MKIRSLIIVVGVVSLLGVSLIAVGQQATAQTEQEPTTPTLSPTPSLNYSHVTVVSAFLRSGPGPHYVPMGALNSGNRLTPLNRSTNGDWILVAYYRNTAGWIRRDLGFWVEDIDSLPIREENDLTPTFMADRTTGTPFYYPTETPSGNYVLTTEENAFVRTGPGLHYDAIGYLSPGAQVVPVGRDQDTTWILIRVVFPPVDESTEGIEGFAWIAQPLIFWTEDLDTLPILTEDNLTPTLTSTQTATPTATNTPTVTASATATHTATSTLTPSLTATPSLTPTNTPLPTATATSTSTLTATETATPMPVPPTDTSVPTATATSTATATETPPPTPAAPTETLVPTATATSTATATETPSPTPVALTDTPVPTATATSTSTLTGTPSPTPVPPTDTSVPTAMDVPTITVTVAPSATDSPVPTQVAVEIVASPSETLTLEIPTNTATSVPAAAETATAAPVVAVLPTDIVLTPEGPGPLLPETPTDDGQKVRLETIVGGLMLLLVLAYIGLYLRGLADVERYEEGFVIEHCPVCQNGTLQVDNRHTRLMGIPRPKRTVRCDVCRSVLRETGHRRWRYAVDPLMNPVMYERFNGNEVDEQNLIRLSQHPVRQDGVVSGPVTPPDFVEGEEDSE